MFIRLEYDPVHAEGQPRAGKQQIEHRLLAEQGDLAQATSSSSTKLFHGGLRYLEHYEFRLVREALIERETLLKAMPHIAWPLRFVLPHHKGLRPAWLLRLGLFIYDHLGGRKLLPPTRAVDLRRDPTGAPLKPDFIRAFEYSDCWVEDSRMAVLAAMDSAGVDVLVYPTYNYPPRLIGDQNTTYGANSGTLSPPTGFPAFNVPMGLSFGTLPAGLQLLGRPFGEPELIRTSYAFEQATMHRRPPTSTPPLGR